MADMAEKTDSDDNQHHHHRFHLHSKRLNQLIHPKTGKIFHVVREPREVEAKRHAVLQENPKACDFDIVIHGTDEHRKAVQDIYQHHKEQHDTLYEKHAETLSSYDRVKNDMDALSDELHMLTDHAVALDASFDKFGYSAHLRTKDDDDSASLLSDLPSRASKHDDRSMTAIRIWKRPTIKQYMHKGLVWRSANSSEVASYELFVDLVYVGLIDTIGEAAVHNASGATFLHYVIIFAIAWKIYTNITAIMNWFEIDDIFGRVSVIFILVCLYSFATNVVYLFEDTYTQGIAFYIAAQVFVGLWWFWAAFLIPLVRNTLLCHAITTAIGVALWIGSIHVEYPARLGLVFAGIIIDVFGAGTLVPLMLLITDQFAFMKRFSFLGEYLPAINIEHRVERTNAFTSLVFGYSVITILFQSRAEFPLTAFLGKGILALVQAFMFNWIYFDIDASGIHVHAIRRHRFSTFVWSTAHLPFSAAFILAASTLSELVITHDGANANIEGLGEDFQSRSPEELEQSLRWFYCGGLGIALLCMTAISLSHIHKRLERTRLRKRPRLAVRAAVAVVIICLPLAHDLTSLQLIGTTTSLIALVLILDIFGNSCSGDEFWTGGWCKERKRRTVYTANCKISKRIRQQMLQKIEAGQSITLEDALRRHDSSSSLEDGLIDFKASHGAGAY